MMHSNLRAPHRLQLRLPTMNPCVVSSSSNHRFRLVVEVDVLRGVLWLVAAVHEKKWGR